MKLSASSFREGRLGAWWEGRAFLTLILLLSAVPLLWPDIPALSDLPGHMGRYKIMLDLDASAHLSRYYEFSWSLVPNLGADLLMVPLGKLLGIELAAKLIVLLIPPLTLAGFAWVAREAHGHLPPSILFAAPFAYGYPFLYGFVNFTLAMGIAFVALGLWLRLGRQNSVRLRAALFAPLSVAVWVAHAFAWGTLGLIAFSFEFCRQRDLGRSIIQGGLHAGFRCLPLAVPMLLILGWQSGEANSATGDWFNLNWKLSSLLSALRDRWLILDMGSVALCLFLIFVALRDRRLTFSKPLALAALLMLAAYILIPRFLFGGANVDSRMAPYLLATALIGIRALPTAPSVSRALALAGLALFLVRTSASTVSFWLHDRSYDAELAALGHVPKGARLVTFVGAKCKESWSQSRLEHLPGLAIVRREAFSNDQWTIAGSHLLRIKEPWTLFADPSQIVTRVPCGPDWMTIDTALQMLPQAPFDYLWLLNPPPYDAAHVKGWKVLWRNGSSALFSIPKAVPAVAPVRP